MITYACTVNLACLHVEGPLMWTSVACGRTHVGLHSVRNIVWEIAWKYFWADTRVESWVSLLKKQPHHVWMLQHPDGQIIIKLFSAIELQIFASVWSGLEIDAKWLRPAFFQMASSGWLHWLQKFVQLYVSLWENDPTSHLIYYHKKPFPQVS